MIAIAMLSPIASMKHSVMRTVLPYLTAYADDGERVRL